MHQRRVRCAHAPGWQHLALQPLWEQRAHREPPDEPAARAHRPHGGTRSPAGHRLMSSTKWERRRFNRDFKRLVVMVERWQNRSDGSLPIKPRHTKPNHAAQRRRRRRGMSRSSEQKQIRSRQSSSPPNYKHGQRPAGRRRPIKRPMTPR